MRVTARGIGLLAGAVVGLAAGFAFGYPELVVLGAAGLFALCFAVVHASWRPHLSVSRVAEPDRVARGDSSMVTLTLHNSSRFRAASLLAEDRCGTAAVPVPVLRLRPGRDTTVDYPVPTTRRGVVPIGPLKVSRRDPFGLVTGARSHGGTTQVWVHPRSYPLAAVPAGVARSLDGRVDRVPHGTITFDTLREYVVGDELRRVHWRTSAKVGELMVREQLDTSLPKLVVLLDDRASSHPDPETFESACEAAASVVVAAVREDLPVILHLVSGAAAGGGNAPAGVARSFLDLLAEATLHNEPSREPSGEASPHRPGNLRTATDRLRQQRLGDTVIFLTGTGGRGDLGLVGALRPAYAIVVVGLFGPRGAAPAGGGAGVVVIDAEDGREFAAEWDGVRGW